MARLNSVSSFFNHKIAPGLGSKSNLISDRAVFDYCIQIESIRINRRTSIPHRINFWLDLTTLKYLEEIKKSKRKLRLSSAKVTLLRCYVLQNAFVEQQIVTNPNYKGLSAKWRSPLTFSTHYSFSTHQQPTVLLRSAIDLKAKISQQIQRDLYQNPQMLTRISQVHYWLISELLTQLPLKSNRSSWLVLSCSLIIATLAGLITWHLFSTYKLLNLIVVLSVFSLLNTRFKKTVVKLIKGWLIYHLIEGFFSKSVLKRQIGLKLLSTLF